jgi:CheY-like chemotaxis protein
VAADLPRGAETILLAEDDASSRAMITSLLREYGYQVIEAADGGEAVDKFRQHRREIGLLLLDVVMPRANGKSVFDSIAGEYPGTKAIFMSGYTADMIHHKGVLERGVSFLSKPVIPSELLTKIRSVLDGK